MMGGGGMGGNGSPNGSPVTLVTMTVSGPVSALTAYPHDPAGPTCPAGPAVRQRRLTFAMGMAGMGAMSFTIDGRTFDPGRDDQTVALGTTEEWTVVNTSPMDHPFHLHAWPFHVLDASTGHPQLACNKMSSSSPPEAGHVYESRSPTIPAAASTTATSSTTKTSA